MSKVLEKVKHAGRFNSRCSDGSPSGEREATFIRLWQKENNPPSFLNQGIGVLCWLLHANHDKRGLYSFLREEVTQEEAMAGATLIQWLGTNCGWDFLNQCVEACGYKIVRAEDWQRQKEMTKESTRQELLQALAECADEQTRAGDLLRSGHEDQRGLKQSCGDWIAEEAIIRGEKLE